MIFFFNNSHYRTAFDVDGSLACTVAAQEGKWEVKVCLGHFSKGTHNVRAELANGKRFSCTVVL
jgi:hypothetical protein